MTRWPSALRLSSEIASGVWVISKILAYAMPPSAVPPAKSSSMSATVTGSLATATTSRWGWEIVQWTGMGCNLTSRPGDGHAKSGRQACRRAATITRSRRSNRERPEDPMNNRDETIREKPLARLATLGVDARNLAVEVEHGMVIARGSVPNEEQRQRAIDALIGAHELQIAVRPVATSDSDDGKGRSPGSGTSGESAHQSRRQTDPS